MKKVKCSDCLFWSEHGRCKDCINSYCKGGNYYCRIDGKKVSPYAYCNEPFPFV